ncbi:ABC transporter ATP-binding protein [uncultured Clostridium sp.]|uniref:ABC transporter ATP-binding protein n=1 Tax=uncultured Clostridium sp. TaxID=59620 RepID=UPI0028E5684D|nr:ABC transporter ATP-binding protein [uncultured Clostridium sp.]
MELTIDRLTKQYGSKIVVDRLTTTFSPGVYGLLGANGSGKTTLMRLICDILDPTSGEIRLNNKDIKEMNEDYRSLLGYLPQNFGYYPEFTAYDFLMYISSLKGLPHGVAKRKTFELLDMVGLKEEKKGKIKTFSGGMRQRLGIAQAMLNDPQLVILDEPTAGLDPKERVRFRNLISSFSKDKIVILSTHIVSDIEYIADTILMMRRGTLIHKGSVHTITSAIKGYVWECQVSKEEADRLNAIYCVSNLKHIGDNISLRIVSESKPCENSITVEPNIEDLYLYCFKGESAQ